MRQKQSCLHVRMFIQIVTCSRGPGDYEKVRRKKNGERGGEMNRNYIYICIFGVFWFFHWLLMYNYNYILCIKNNIT